MTDDLISRLTAGINEDQEIAVSACLDFEYEDWTALGESVDAINESNVAHPVESTYNGDVAKHIARHDPARERHDVALKRLILAGHTPLTTKDYESPGHAVEIVVCACCSFLPSPQTDAYPDYVSWPCEYIKTLAVIYAEPTETGERP